MPAHPDHAREVIHFQELLNPLPYRIGTATTQRQDFEKHPWSDHKYPLLVSSFISRYVKVTYNTRISYSMRNVTLLSPNRAIIGTRLARLWPDTLTTLNAPNDIRPTPLRGNQSQCGQMT
jgi:hypothetical protein